jgi:hypothetical protein
VVHVKPTSMSNVLVYLPPRFINVNLELIEYNTLSATTQKPRDNTLSPDLLPRHRPKMTSFWSIFVREAIFTLIGFYTSFIVILILILHEKDVKISYMLQGLVDSILMSKKVEYLQTLKMTMETLLRKATSLPWKRICNVCNDY